jgi:thymidylate kinase
LSDDLYDSFIHYQLRMAGEFHKMASQYRMVRIDGNKPIAEVNRTLQGRIDKYLRAI